MSSACQSSCTICIDVRDPIRPCCSVDKPWSWAEQLAAGLPEDPAFKDLLAVCHNNYGDVLMRDKARRGTASLSEGHRDSRAHRSRAVAGRDVSPSPSP